MPQTSTLSFPRFILVVASLSPIFVLWGIRGQKDWWPYWEIVCALLFIAPNAFLLWFKRRAEKVQNERTIAIRSSKDQREHMLIYLFAMLIPLYDANMDGWRDIAALAFAFLFVIFLFWHMNLHYMNLLLAIRGYKIYTVETGAVNASDRRETSNSSYVVISKRHTLPVGELLVGYRLGGGVLLDTKTC